MSNKTIANSINLYKEGKTEQSIADLKEIIALGNNSIALFNLAFIYANVYKNNIEKLLEAKVYLSKALDLNFDSEKIKKLNNSIDVIYNKEKHLQELKLRLKNE